VNGAGSFWGRAVYFASDALYSCKNYFHKNSDGTKCVILAKVIVGKSHSM